MELSEKDLKFGERYSTKNPLLKPIPDLTEDEAREAIERFKERYPLILPTDKD